MNRMMRSVESTLRAVAERSGAASGYFPAAKAPAGEVVPFPPASKPVNKKLPDAIDVHVGSRIKLRRKMRGMSQQKLAAGLGITFQQVQKYEKGTNRVGSSRLQNIANILGVPVSYFFDEAPATAPSNGAFEPDAVTQFLSSSEGIELNTAFVKIGDPKVRAKVIALVKSLGDSE